MVRLTQKKYNTILQQISMMPGAANRVRAIYPSNNIAHYYGTVLATASLHNVEKGVGGHPSTRPEVIQRWRNLYDRFNDTHRIYVIAMDCKNATTNFQLFLKLVPEPIRQYLDLTSITVQPTTAGFYVNRNGYCSAVWYTTFEHVHKGNFEGIRVLYHTLNQLSLPLYPEAQAVANHLTCLMTADDYAQIGDRIFTCPFLGTDDVLFPFAVPKGTPKPVPSKIMLDATMMDASITQDGVVAFGMRGLPNDLVENQSSRISKLFTSEHMGFCPKDGLAAYERIHNCGYTDVIDYCLRTHFGYGHENYYPLLEMYKRYLSSIGVRVEDTINFYSPVERLIYGDLVSDDPVCDSSALDPEEVDGMLTELKKVFLGGNYA